MYLCRSHNFDIPMSTSIYNYIMVFSYIHTSALTIIIMLFHTVHPVIVRVSNDIDVVISNTTYVVCLATGYPVPTVTWLKDSAPVNLYNNVSFNMRVDIFEFDSRNISNEISGFVGSVLLERFLNKNTVTSLGELDIVSILRFHSVVREDTATYSCVASNRLEQTTTLRETSDPVQITILG